MAEGDGSAPAEQGEEGGAAAAGSAEPAEEEVKAAEEEVKAAEEGEVEAEKVEVVEVEEDPEEAARRLAVRQKLLEGEVSGPRSAVRIRWRVIVDIFGSSEVLYRTSRQYPNFEGS